MVLETGFLNHKEGKGAAGEDPWSPLQDPYWAPQVTAGKQRAPLVVLGPVDPASLHRLQGYGQQSHGTHYAF